MIESLGSAVLHLTTTKEKFSGELKEAKIQAQGIGTTFSGIGNIAQTVFGVTAVGAIAMATKAISDFAIDSMKMAQDFETSVNQITALVGISAEQTSAWSEQMLQMAPDLRKFPIELSKGMFFITSAGLRGQSALDALTASAKLSASGLGELDTISDALTSTINAYGEANITATESGDILISTVREGKLEAGGLAKVIGRVIPIASTMGVEFHEVGASIAAMSKTGLTAAEATTALRDILNTLLDPADSVANTMELVGTSADEVRNQIREKGLLDALENLKTLADDNSVSMSEFFPNVQGLTGVLSLLGENAETNAEIFERMADTSGTMNEAFKITAETAEQKLMKAMSGLQSESVTLGENLNTVAVPIKEFAIEAVTDFVASINTTFKALGDTMSGEIPVWEGALKVGKEIFGSFVFFTKQQFRAVIEILESMGIDVRGAMEETGKWLGERFVEIGEGVRNIVDNMINNFVNLKNSAIEAVQGMILGIGEWFENRFAAIGEGVRNIVDNIGGFFADLANKVVGQSIVPDMVNSILEWFEYLSISTESILIRMSKTHGEKWNEMANKAIYFTRQMTESVSSVLDAYFNWRLSQEGMTEKESEKILEQQAKAQKAYALISIAINTAVAIMQAYAQLGPVAGTVAAVLIGIAGGIQAGLVAATPIPSSVSVTMPEPTDFEMPEPTGYADTDYIATTTGDIGAAATFQQQRPIIVTIDVHDNQVYGGSLREFAIMLRSEMEAVGELGL